MSRLFLSRNTEVPTWNRFILTEIYLCHACSCQEILRMGTACQAHSGARSPLWLKLLAEAVATHYRGD
eukprot:COSAG01_NODE_17243_length_1167_cov_1.277154_1_plen_67_part_10